MSQNIVDAEENQKAIDARKTFQKDISLKAGNHVDFGQFKKCRKIFTTVSHGTIRFEIRGDYHSDMTCQAGFSGGPLSNGGGDFSPGTLTIKVFAPVDASFYIHIEWLEASMITISG